MFPFPYPTTGWQVAQKNFLSRFWDLNPPNILLKKKGKKTTKKVKRLWGPSSRFPSPTILQLTANTKQNKTKQNKMSSFFPFSIYKKNSKLNIKIKIKIKIKITLHLPTPSLPPFFYLADRHSNPLSNFISLFSLFIFYPSPSLAFNNHLIKILCPKKYYNFKMLCKLFIIIIQDL